ncbi:hypothetical protein HMPREF1548_01475 [Clostridium sp. KLE 1755]|nr:hypothetical protein HMPREF1548_01475 [Clostridium sp. KLE 1755]
MTSPPFLTIMAIRVYEFTPALFYRGPGRKRRLHAGRRSLPEKNREESEDLQ